MEKRRHSMTAIAGAFVRAHHYAYDDPKIFADSLAHVLISPGEREAFEKMYVDLLAKSNPALASSSTNRAALVGHALRAGMSGAVFLARARYVEDMLAEAIHRGVNQYVVIGAGFDTVALRPPFGADIQIFELDHPDTQAVKQHRIAEAGLVPPAHLHFVQADLEQESVAAALARGPYNPGAPALFAWPGVTMYLTRDAIVGTLRSIRSIAAGRSELIFDYLEADAFRPGRASERVQRMMEAARGLGEPMLSGFDPPTLGSELANVGFQLIEDLDPSDLEGRYFKNRSDGFLAPDHVHFVRASVA